MSRDWLQGPVQTRPEKFEGEVCFLSENASNFFRQSPAVENLKGTALWGFWVNHTIINTSSFSKISVFKMSFVYTKTKRRNFQILPIWRAFSWQISVDGRPLRRSVDAILVERLIRCVLARNRPSSVIVVTKRICFLASQRSKSTEILCKLHLHMRWSYMKKRSKWSCVSFVIKWGKCG